MGRRRERNDDDGNGEVAFHRAGGKRVADGCGEVRSWDPYVHFL